MEWVNVQQRIEGGEDARTEFMRDFEDFSDIGKTLCAFANGNGGLLVLGVDDRGVIVGVEMDPEDVEERLTGVLNSGCGRPVTADCNRRLTDEGWVHWVDVPRHRRGYEPFSYDGGFWVRRGRSTSAPSPSELQDLLNVFGLALAEQQVLASATASDIDPGAFDSFMRAQGMETDDEPQPDIESDLRNAWVCEERDQVLRPTLYGVLVFGRRPQGHPHTTSLYIQCAAYAGTDRAADVVSAGEGKGRLDEQVQRSMGWFRSLARREIYPGPYRRDVPPMPEEVLREALVNAVIHRDYAISGSPILLEVFDDRILVTSPGALPDHMTVEHARGGGAPRLRNEMMANAMVVRRLMEGRGRGWLKMRRAMKSFNGTEPTLLNDEINRLVQVTFHLDPDPVENGEMRC